MEYRYTAKSLEDTRQLGLLLGKHARKSDIIILEGDLGAGKTTLTQSIAIGLDVHEKEYVTSPSFAILHEYEGRIPLYHMDLYRLGGEDEVVDLGFDEYFFGSGLCVIEWPSRAGELLPSHLLSVTIRLLEDDLREFIFRESNADFWISHIQESLG